jgi:hypothetical protein
VKGVEAKVHWYARNDGPGGADNFNIEIFLGNARFQRGYLSPTPAGTPRDDEVGITPEDCGNVTLLYRVTSSASDPNEGNNQLVSSVNVTCP